MEALIASHDVNNLNSLTELVNKAIELPTLFVFGELLELPLIKQMTDGQLINLLHLFCYGTYSDYKSAQNKLPLLTEPQIRKLRQLTIIAESYQNRQLPYDLLQQKLELNDIHELEELIIELIYLEAIRAKIDQRNNLLIVEHSIGRDVKLEELDDISKNLAKWRERVLTILHEVGKDIKKSNVFKMKSEQHKGHVNGQFISHKAGYSQQRLKIESEPLKMDIDDFSNNAGVPSSDDRDHKFKINVIKNIKKGFTSK